MSAKGVRILIVDDQPFMRWTIRQLLAEIGITDVHEAGDAKRALEETQRLRPAAVLCDIHMPGEDGLVYLAQLRALASAGLARTPVIFLTADKTIGAVAEAKRLAADGYLVKPVAIDAMKKALDRVLAAREV